MRCAECGERIAGRPVKRGKLVFCSGECAEAAEAYGYENPEDDDRGIDEFEEDLDRDRDDDYAYDADEDDR